MSSRSSSPDKESGDQVVVITRVFDAPRELVWRAWTECERLMRWWGPKGFTTPFCKIDLRAGGVYRNSMRSPEGKDYWSTGTYREIVPLLTRRAEFHGLCPWVNVKAAIWYV